ncbi:MAG: hypothetical protein F6K32_04675, partial [Desertifilum sp. SIO1I2]|nr:hypothetical protein [Desertifilum sp. SIO1I2]
SSKRALSNGQGDFYFKTVVWQVRYYFQRFLLQRSIPHQAMASLAYYSSERSRLFARYTT